MNSVKLFLVRIWTTSRLTGSNCIQVHVVVVASNNMSVCMYMYVKFCSARPQKITKTNGSSNIHQSKMPMYRNSLSFTANYAHKYKVNGTLSYKVDIACPSPLWDKSLHWTVTTRWPVKPMSQHRLRCVTSTLNNSLPLASYICVYSLLWFCHKNIFAYYEMHQKLSLDSLWTKFLEWISIALVLHVIHYQLLQHLRLQTLNCIDGTTKRFHISQGFIYNMF